MHPSLFLAAIPTAVWATIFVVVGLVFLLFVIILGQFFNLWLQAWLSGAHVGFLELIGMRLRKVDPRVIVLTRISAIRADIDLGADQLESHYLAGGRVPNVVRALIAADRAKIPLDFNLACAIDLAGRDVLDAVQTSVKPKVIDVPDPGRGRATIDAVAKDGVQLKAKARVTVRANIQRLVGGALEETIIARVGEGIVTTIGSAQTHKEVLENPDSISKKILEKGLDAGTAFEILSVDIADVDVGENIGARLQVDQAEADKKRFQAEAEKRRALAMAQEAENRAVIELNRAKVVEAEVQVPLAIAEAFRAGHLGIMDYYRLRNIQADTSMRSAVAGQETQQQDQDDGSTGSGPGMTGR